MLTNTAGTALTDLADHRIAYGNSVNSLTQVMQIANSGVAHEPAGGKRLRSFLQLSRISMHR